MDAISPTRDLRVCGTCWSVVHPNDLSRHADWHEAVRDEALAEAWAQVLPHAG